MESSAAWPIPLDTSWLARDPERCVMQRRRSHEEEFELFFVAHFAAVRDTVRWVCGDPGRADDATQEAFIKAYARWGRVRRFDDPVAWIRRVAINATRDAARSERRRADREARAHAPWPPPIVQDVQHDSPLELLRQLPERQRAVAALYYLDGLSTAEIADALGIAEGTVRFHLSHARTTLKAGMLSDQELDGGR